MDFIPPQLAYPAKTVPNTSDWLVERKYDGYRMQASMDGRGGVRLFTRSGIDWTHRLNGLSSELATGRESATLDGELCVVGNDGSTNLAALPPAIERGERLVFLVFDIMRLNGADLTGIPLIERKLELRRYLAGNFRSSTIVTELPWFEGSKGPLMFAEMAREGHEGVVAKVKTSHYVAGKRLPSWRKVKCRRTELFLVVGWTPDASGTKVKSIALASTDSGALCFRGQVGSGLNEYQRLSLARELLDALPREPLATLCNSELRWVTSALQVRVRYLEFSARGLLREPVIDGAFSARPGN